MPAYGLMFRGDCPSEGDYLMVSIGGINVVEALIQAEQRIFVLEKTVEALLNARPTTTMRLNIDVSAFREEAVADLQRKYPQLGIKASES